MSNAIFPDFQGIAWPVGISPKFATKTQTSVSLRESRARLAAYPIYTIKVTFEFLRSSEFDTAMGFFNTHGGSFESFLWDNKDDNSIVDQVLGMGDNSRTQWQLLRSKGGFVEPCENIKTVSSITVDGVVQAPTSYTVTSTGLLVFVSPPAADKPISWSGSFYYRCRFGADSADFEKFLRDLWQLKTLTMVGALGNKV